MKNGVMYLFPAGLVLAMKQRAQKNILGSASFWRAARFFGNSIAFMFPVSTPAKAASLPLPKSKVNSRAPTSASGSKSRATIPKPVASTSTYTKTEHLGSPARALTRQEKMDQRMIDGAQHTFATKYLRKPSVPVFGGSSSSVLNVVNVENSDNSDTSPVKLNVAKETPTKSAKDPSSASNHWRPAGSNHFSHKSTTPQTPASAARDKSIASRQRRTPKAMPKTTPRRKSTGKPGIAAVNIAIDDPSAKNLDVDVKPGTARLADLCEEDKMKVAKLIEQLMKLGAENEVSAAQFDEEKDHLQESLRAAQSEASVLLEKTNVVQSKYAQSLDLIKGYQTRLRQLATERESVVSENQQEKMKRDEALKRESDLREEVEYLRRKAERQQIEIQDFAELEKKQADLVLRLRAKIVSRDAARSAQSRLSVSTSAVPSLQNTEEKPDVFVETSAQNASQEEDSTGEEPNIKKTVHGQALTRDVQTRLEKSTPRTRKELGKVTTAVVSKLEQELSEARSALDRLREEQNQIDKVQGDVQYNSGDEVVPKGENIEFESLEMSEKHVRIRDTPEMWDGVSVDAMALPFTTRRHPSKAKAINEDFEEKFSVPLPKKSPSPKRLRQRRLQRADKKSKQTNRQDNANDIDTVDVDETSLDVFENDMQKSKERPRSEDAAIRPLWGRASLKNHSTVQKKGKIKGKIKRKKKKSKNVQSELIDSSVSFDFNSGIFSGDRLSDTSSCYYEESLFDLVDQMEELDETMMSDSNISDHDFSNERKVGLHVSSTNNQFTGIGYVLAPAPEAKKRRKYARRSKSSNIKGKRSFAGNKRANNEQVDPDAWWSSVGSLLNSKNSPRKRVVKVMPAGGRNGDYWGTYTRRKPLAGRDNFKVHQ